MTPTVQLWSGREVRALREAKRMSIRAFAAHLGVSERMVSKWEKGAESIHPRPVNQQALDSSLAASSADVQARFANLVGPTAVPAPAANPARQATQPAVPAPLPLNEPHQVRHPIDGKLMTLVEEGIFLAGENNEPLHLPAFYIDVFPTTNADYARFVAATGHPSPQHWNGNNPPDGIFDHPVVFVTWHDATAYAQWAAKALPTSQQWEKAARGTRGDTYPWGSQLTPAKCNVRESDLRTTTPVNRYHSGVSPYGVYDMCGNTWEWCSTESEPGRHELKGSAFTSPFLRCTPSTFNDASADMLDDDTGFRCVTPAETLRALLRMNG
ncbi:Formylglycine-generating enzyme, required for sulfatase activity, contains SUMF1/FGE domain [Thermomonospora echinospora]|uniref:Formylglycine-generating enzyme, required for sulfatase activity, contains SUMF1/FGE domain n=1 Tax=Thermomonospora echinospora TaxID=1992 RepID=A0A1H6CSW5_9ACTN|nr:SUMF1/EgtB/PvdO family nonheme iron enzyme [Thermomonospora echinospora]SEG75526.1 Formylglycine-generating enzyme, required for sulfatase activity, contains SUMF1/FGE domain [Thermomonospora echinospora]